MASFFLYLSTASLSTFFLFLFKKEKRQIRYFLFVIGCLIPTILSGLRNNVGTDYIVYEGIFNFIKASNSSPLFSNLHGFDPLFYLLNRFVGLLGNFRLFLMVTSFIIVFGHLSSIYLLSKKYSFSFLFVSFFFLIGPFLTSFNLIAQYTATSFGLIAFSSKTKLSAYFFFVISILFHFSGIIFILLILFKNFKKGSFQLISFIFYIISFFPIIVVEILETLNLPIPDLYFSPTVNLGNNNDYYLHLLFLFTIFFLNKIFKNSHPDIFFWFNVISLGFFNFGFFNIYIKRFANHFSIILAISLSKSFEFLRIKSHNSFNLMFLAFIFIVLSYYSFVILGFSNLIPYDYSIYF
jgi:hypothetical protein